MKKIKLLKESANTLIQNAELFEWVSSSPNFSDRYKDERLPQIERAIQANIELLNIINTTK